MDSGRGEVEFVSVFVPVASLAVNFGSECIFWKPVEKTNFKVHPSNGGNTLLLNNYIGHTILKLKKTEINNT